MCPFCISTVAVAIVSTTSAGGLAALAAKMVGKRRRAAREAERLIHGAVLPREGVSNHEGGEHSIANV